MADYRFSREHIWVLREDGKARIGISDFAREELGEIVYIELPEPGREVSAGDVVCSLDSLKSSSEIYMPVSGKISAVNEKLASDKSLEVINNDPQGEGWILEVELRDADELSSLMNEAEYRSFVSE